MPKKIVILLDGTSNEIKTNRSNILRLYGTLTKSKNQLVYYDPGVGTFGAENTWSQIIRKGVEVWGMATGWWSGCQCEGSLPVSGGKLQKGLQRPG